MRFEQYQMLKQYALAACEAAGAKFPEVGQMNPIILAYVGDVVFSMYVRLSHRKGFIGIACLF